MPRYNPKEASEPNPLFPKGEYNAVVKRATEKTSSGGNNMIELILTCYGPGDSTTDVFDYLVFTPAILYKVRHFCESAGIDFNKGDLTAEECLDMNVKVKLKIDKGDEKYREKNAVDDYVGTTAARTRATVGAAPAAKPADADIPF